ncbi:hypothetical protein GMRT_14393 [Giardia muris]|uniref:Uncharacterized protein n=1 Tax=Giardia muris TaxID=5742 RepID=A0A4Z1T6X4_GIAMU|nr:hypothetical protein GMRT_14393 [Giardia muris]|eukprot:TNJ28241.1 hypothetical protein GMRT_14393 [Giardia muris]
MHETVSAPEPPIALKDAYTLINEILAVEDVELALLNCSTRLTRPYTLLEVATLWANVLYNPAFITYLQSVRTDSSLPTGFHKTWGESQLLLALSCVDHLQQTEPFPLTPEMRLRLPPSFSVESNPLRRLALLSMAINKTLTSSTTATTPTYLPYAALRPGYRKSHIHYARFATSIPMVFGSSTKEQTLIRQTTVDALVVEGEIEFSTLLTLNPSLSNDCKYVLINPIKTVVYRKGRRQPLLIGGAPRCDVCVGAVDPDAAPQHVIITEREEKEKEPSVVLMNIGYDQSVRGGIYRAGFETTLQDIPAGTQIDLAQVTSETRLIIYINAIPFILFPLATPPQ